MTFLLIKNYHDGQNLWNGHWRESTSKVLYNEFVLTGILLRKVIQTFYQTCKNKTLTRLKILILKFDYLFEI